MKEITRFKDLKEVLDTINQIDHDTYAEYVIRYVNVPGEGKNYWMLKIKVLRPLHNSTWVTY